MACGVRQLLGPSIHRRASSSRLHSPLVGHVRCRQSRLSASRSCIRSATACAAQAAAGSNGLAQKAAGMLVRTTCTTVSSTMCQIAVSRQSLAMQGYLVLLGSLVRSLPQCIRIVKSNSAEGVSLSAVVAELVAFTITIAYNVQRGKLLLLAWPAPFLFLKQSWSPAFRLQLWSSPGSACPAHL